MTEPVSDDRWGEAQVAEREYWQWPAIDAREFVQILAGLAEAAVWASQRFPDESPPAGDWLEIGIGPIGIGCIHFLPQAASKRLVGIDPLERMHRTELSLPRPLLAAVKVARSMYDHHLAPGEATALESSRFGLAVLHNVLDHVRDPKAVLQEARRVLRPKGVLFLACDTHSWLYQVRHKLVIRRTDSESWLVRAHPFQFRPSELFALVNDNGFQVLSHNLANTLVTETFGKTTRLLILARRD